MTLAQRDPALLERLACLARDARMIFVAGLPGTGKSLVIHQLVHLAVGAGRPVHLLQWDVARPVFEASAAGQRYPVVDGVTQPMIRKAAGFWARGAIATWSRRHPGLEFLLIAETPLVGGRFLEVAQPADDEAEPLLADRATRFVIAVPSAAVRRHVEAERERRASAPQHAREREDAPPHVLHALWTEVLTAARSLGLAGETVTAAYDPDVYRRVFDAVLRARRPEIIALEVVLPTASMSVYDFTAPYVDVVPRGDEADAFVRAAERACPDHARLAQACARWWAG